MPLLSDEGAGCGSRLCLSFLLGGQAPLVAVSVPASAGDRDYLLKVPVDPTTVFGGLRRPGQARHRLLEAKTVSASTGTRSLDMGSRGP